MQDSQSVQVHVRSKERKEQKSELYGFNPCMQALSSPVHIRLYWNGYEFILPHFQERNPIIMDIFSHGILLALTQITLCSFLVFVLDNIVL